MTHQSMFGSTDDQIMAGGTLMPQVMTAAGTAANRRPGQTRSTLPDRGFNGLRVDADRGATTGTSTTDLQSRYLLLAVLGAWVGFLGLIAIAANQAFLIGAVALILGLLILMVGLRGVFHDQPVVGTTGGRASMAVGKDRAW